MTSAKGGYREAGVDLASADDALARVRELVASTYTPGVLKGLGAFGGLFELPQGLERPVLVASTDGVGTKTMVAMRQGAYPAIGRDLVDHCVNDILVQGARPLFFLDYVASSRLEPAVTAAVVEGVAEACRANGAALLGGEMAEMPGVYREGELDVVGTIVGIVERRAVLDGSAVREGDVLLGWPRVACRPTASAWRAMCWPTPWTSPSATERSPTPCWRRTGASSRPSPRSSPRPAWCTPWRTSPAAACRATCPARCPTAWARWWTGGAGRSPPSSGSSGSAAPSTTDEMARVFNLGVGFVLVVPPERVEQARRLCPEPLMPIGRVERGAGVRFR